MCDICRTWEYFSQLGVDLYRGYRQFNNISYLFPAEVCGSNCARICCKNEVLELRNNTYSTNEYRDIINIALDLDKYDTFMYARAIVASICIADYELINHILSYVNFDTIITRQKLAYHQSKLDLLEINARNQLKLLEQRVDRDKLTQNYNKLFGSALQQLILGLLPQAILKDLINTDIRYQLRVQAYALLDKQFIASTKTSGEIEFQLVKFSRLPFVRKLEMLQQNVPENQQIALVHNLTNTEITEILQSDVNIQVSAFLKLLSQVNDTDLLYQFVSHSNSYIQAFSIYRITQLTRVDPYFNHQLENYTYDILKNEAIFVPSILSDQQYYEILIDNPDHNLSEYLIQIISNTKLLQKLSFHTKLRRYIKNRLTILNFGS